MMVDDCTVMLMAEDRLRVVGGPGMPGQVVPFAQARGLRATPRRDDLAHLTVQGPNSRALLARLTDADMSNEAFPYYTFREAMSVAGVEMFVTRLGFTAELGYELFIPAGRALDVWDALVREGAGLGVRPVGAAAILTARTEAGMVMGELEYDGSVSPYECLLGWAVDLEKGDFQGREALVTAREDAPNRTVSVVLDEGGEAATGARLLAGGRDTGHVTMAVVSPHLHGATLGLARVRREDAAPGTRLDAVLEDGTRTGAEVRRTPVYDPERTRVRS
jgi:aminomethyltransferase